MYAHFVRRVAVLIITNAMVGHPLPSFFATEYHVYMYYYCKQAAVYRHFAILLLLAIQILWGYCPPSVKLVASLWRGRVDRDGYRDQIVTRLHSVMWVCLCFPRHIHSSWSTVMALLRTQYPGLFPVLFLQSLYVSL